jgi:hypothetical protein
MPAAISAEVGTGREVGGTHKPSLMVGSPVNAMHPARIVSDAVNAMYPARIVSDAVNAMHSAWIVGRHIGHPSGTAVDDHRLRVFFHVIVGRGWIAVGHWSIAVRRI